MARKGSRAWIEQQARADAERDVEQGFPFNRSGNLAFDAAYLAHRRQIETERWDRAELTRHLRDARQAVALAKQGGPSLSESDYWLLEVVLDKAAELLKL